MGLGHGSDVKIAPDWKIDSLWRVCLNSDGLATVFHRIASFGSNIRSCTTLSMENKANEHKGRPLCSVCKAVYVWSFIVSDHREIYNDPNGLHEAVGLWAPICGHCSSLWSRRQLLDALFLRKDATTLPRPSFIRRLWARCCT